MRGEPIEMITLTIECSRCSKEVSQDMTNSTLSNDEVRKLGFVYAHNGKTNVVICIDCESKYKGLQDKLELTVAKEICDFFGDCGEEGKNGDYRGEKIG
jgi:hypothetical protein